MKLLKTLGLAATLAASTFTAQQVAAVEVSASAAVASSYLFRGIDLGAGSAAVSADITASLGGAYATVWTSSGDDAAGQEYDVVLGYGGEVAGVSYDVSAISYVYPGAGDTNINDVVEVAVTLGYGPVSISHYDNTAGYTPTSGLISRYTVVNAELGSFSGAVGTTVGLSSDYTHIDATYAVNDNLSFTASKVVNQDATGVDESTNIIASYSIPLL